MKKKINEYFMRHKTKN